MLKTRNISVLTVFVLILLSFCNAAVNAEEKRTLSLENFDRLNRRMTDSGSVWYGYGNIRLRLDSTRISSDSVIWYREQNTIHFYGNVEAYDSVQTILAEELSYYHQDSILLARKNVVLINTEDSIKTMSHSAEYDRAGRIVYLEGEPRLYLNYPDSANMVEILGDYLTFYADNKSAEAEDNVVITHKDTRATCGCAEYFDEERFLILRDEPHAVRDSSEMAGQLMEIQFSGRGVRQIDVYEDAVASFVEESDSTSGEFSGDSELSGNQITFYFRDDQIRKIAAVGEARSDYYPSPDDTTGAGKNFVSGDTIYIFVDNQRISKAEIKGGAEGLYITEKEIPDEEAVSDSSVVVVGDTVDSLDADIVADTAESADPVLPDSLMIADADSLGGADSVTVPGVAEDTIKYNGTFLEYFAANRIIRITGNAAVRQGQVSLDADRVDYDVPGRIVLARSLADSADSNAEIKPVVLKDGGEEIYGSSLVFNVDSKKGKIEDATTQYENAYYRGQDLYKTEEKVFFVDDGRLSSCDLEEPHFHFRCNQMKLIHNDRVIAKPVTLYLETIPVMRIPYYIFPLKRGRHSGILPIKLGNFEQGNRFIGNIGYYWAASEYWDTQLSLDFQENTGITLNNIFRYNKRYSFNGNIYTSYSRDRTESVSSEYKRDRWRIRGNHSQTLPYEIDFKASGEFVSDKNYSTDFSTDPDERRNRNIISKANFNKRFGKSSLSWSFSHTNNLDTESKSSSLPTGSFSMPQFHPFGSGKEVDGELKKKWYNEIYVGYGNSFGFLTNESKKTDIVAVDDTTDIEYESRTWKDFGYIDHRIKLSASQKILKYISIGPNLNLQETWYYILKSDQAQEAGIPADRPYRRASISAGISSRTDLYGTFPINLAGFLALRHVMSPSLSFSWSPSITKNDAVRKFTSRGGGSNIQQKRFSFGLQHLFQAKVKSGESDKKLDLLRVGSNLSYNLEAEERKFSNISTSLSSTLSRNVNVRGSLSHDLYDKDNELRWRSPSLKSFSLSGTFQARGSVADDYTRQGVSYGLDRDTLDSSQRTGLDVDLSEPGSSGSKSDWNLNLSYYYSETKSFGVTTGRTHWVQYTFNMGLTKNWKLKYSQKYDFIKHKSIDKIIDLYRKMHCWEAHFYWIPDGSRQGYYFKINVIAIPDIKAEKSESGLRGSLFNR